MRTLHSPLFSRHLQSLPPVPLIPHLPSLLPLPSSPTPPTPPSITLLGESSSPIRSRLVVGIFVVSDFVSFLIQVSGAGLLLSSTNIKTIDTGERVLVGGLVVQALSTGLFFNAAGILCIVHPAVYLRVPERGPLSSNKKTRSEDVKEFWRYVNGLISRKMRGNIAKDAPASPWCITPRAADKPRNSLLVNSATLCACQGLSCFGPAEPALPGCALRAILAGTTKGHVGLYKPAHLQTATTSLSITPLLISLPSQNNMSTDWSATFFHYEPTTFLAYSALAGFALVAIVHMGYFFTHRSFFMWPFVAGSLMECVGFGARIFAINNPFESKYHEWTLLLRPTLDAAQHGLIVLAPVFFSAGYYVILSRTINLLGDAYSPIRSRLVVGIFVSSDLISFIIQVSGSGLLLGSTDIDMINIGEKVLVGGLVVQAVSTALFLLLVVVVTVRAKDLQGSWKRIIAVLLLGAVLILVRSIYRVAEFSGGFTGPLALNETLMYILDILLMFNAAGVLCLVHPAVHLRVTEREPLRPSVDPSEMEMSGSK
ncbi:hypothetical protein M427DRAFT_38692 [Gonapodya prolifera JEL478]|uniref:RTA1-domain-containing protein n=1 Tax=Gonapodya prolifera (strain JEL478) TaxID=1344416 RepID=A0A138ZYG8_GONPJ|nr:hypothetical protein M427DRAFT_38692 [Gonapodya prolifera JEL478]|eukprot:KXS09547.1 hypothetical protein M427DRAFT_38692 [Gonapodya prolifera JEL478]